MVINLANKEKSQIKYDIINFSDSQKLLNIHNAVYLEGTIDIHSRMSWDDLQLIIQAVRIARQAKDVKTVNLHIPYILGGRSDRQFSLDGVNYLKQVIAPIFNSLYVNTIFTQDPHSIATENTIDRLEYVTRLDMVYGCFSKEQDKNTVLISPDEGAIKRTENIAKLRKSPLPVIKCVKNRNIATGTILEVEILSSNLAGKHCIVVDDICDGGATFLALAEELQRKGAEKLTLCVSHGIFSKGFDELKKYYSEIITTNSVREFTEEERKQVKVINVI